MDYRLLTNTIENAIKNKPLDRTAYKDMLSALHQWEQEEGGVPYKYTTHGKGWTRLPEYEDEFQACHAENHIFREMCTKALTLAQNADDVDWFYDMYKASLLFDTMDYFDAYLQYIELERNPQKRFYAPRRHYLKPVIEGYQEIADGKIKLLTVSMCKRAGKSQLGINFVNFLSGRHPERATLMEGVGDDLIKSFYKGCLEYLVTPNEYLYYDIFPEAKLTATNADDKTINLKGKRRFPTIMCRSIDSRQVGLSEATNLLYLDDCVEGREEAKNRQRLEDKWEIISGDIMGRAIEGTPMVFCGTRYSIYDPIGKVQEYAAKMGWPWKAIEIPALDPVTDESNYEYEREGKKVFTTQFFREQRELLSEEQFESEFQQQPFEAKGLVLPKKDLNYFFSLPKDREPDIVIAVCDTAEKGSDSTAMPIAAIYGMDVYIVDVVFDNSPPDITKPECANALIKNKVADACFESNNAGEYYARDVMELCEKHGYPIGIRTKRTVSNKQTRIEFASDNIKKHFYFKDPSTYERSSQYSAFMREATSHTRSGKVAHDDAIDSLSLLENEIRTMYSRTIEIFERPF